MLKLRDKVLLVTGARKGIGAGIAIEAAPATKAMAMELAPRRDHSVKAIFSIAPGI